MLLLHVTTSIAGLRDNGKCANKSDGQFVDHCMSDIVSFLVRCTLHDMRKEPCQNVCLVSVLFRMMMFERRGISDRLC